MQLTSTVPFGSSNTAGGSSETTHVTLARDSGGALTDGRT
jgi:hypothetical protein